MNERIIKIPDDYRFKKYDVYDFESALTIYNWEITHEKVVIDMTRCFNANYQALALLTLSIWHINSRDCHIEFVFNENQEGASKMWRLMGATSWYYVLTKAPQNISGNGLVHLTARQITSRTLSQSWPGTFVLVDLRLGEQLDFTLYGLMSEFREAAQKLSNRQQQDSQDKHYLSIENYFGRFAEDKESAIRYRDR
jgi:hypothetical protein